jgi:hypothetical protein
VLRCLGCAGGLVLYAVQTQCVPCQIANCSSCSVDNSGVFSCAACAATYYLSGNSCVLCATAVQYCSSCQKDQNGKLVCTSCASDKLYLNGNQCLANCTLAGKPNCQTCQLASLGAGLATCTACLSGYFLSSASQNCEACAASSPGCSNCSLSGIVTVCLGCSPGYFLSAGSCVACSTVQPNCELCSIGFGSTTGQCT